MLTLCIRAFVVALHYFSPLNSVLHSQLNPWLEENEH
jgi:hypothetical protein